MGKMIQKLIKDLYKVDKEISEPCINKSQKNSSVALGLIQLFGLIILSFSLSGCMAAHVNECYVFVPIHPIKQDIKTISPELSRQLLIHNRLGQKLCNWR